MTEVSVSILSISHILTELTLPIHMCHSMTSHISHRERERERENYSMYVTNYAKLGFSDMGFLGFRNIFIHIWNILHTSGMHQHIFTEELGQVQMLLW